MNDDTPLYKLNKYPIAVAVALAVNSVAVSAPCTDHKYVTMEIISRFYVSYGVLTEFLRMNVILTYF